MYGTEESLFFFKGFFNEVGCLGLGQNVAFKGL